MTMMIQSKIKTKSSDKRRKIRYLSRLQPTNARDARGTLAREGDARTSSNPRSRTRKSKDDLCADDDGARARRKLACARARDVRDDASKDDDVAAADDDDDDDATRGARARGRCG